MTDIALRMPIKKLRRKDKTLKRLIKELRAYCHAPHCRFLTSCPSLHKKCKEKLGLDTAIAWQAANLLEEVREVSNIIPQINQLRYIVLQHSLRYHKLAILLQDVCDYLSKGRRV